MYRKQDKEHKLACIQRLAFLVKLNDAKFKLPSQSFQRNAISCALTASELVELASDVRPKLS